MQTDLIAIHLASLGSMLLLGLSAQWLAHKLNLPRVTLLILLGIAIGPSGLDLVSEVATAEFEWISTVALAMVGFLLGGKLTRKFIAKQGRIVLNHSIIITLATWLTVALAMGLLLDQWALGLLLGAIATATDPAAVHDVINEHKNGNDYNKQLLGIVALDDIWGLMVFGLSLVIAGQLLPDNGTDGTWHVAYELLGGVGLGLALGLIIGYITGRTPGGEPILIEALGAVLLCAGIALWLDVSYLLACITMGITVTNTARHHKRPFHAIDHIEWPFMMLFFILAGASLSLPQLQNLGAIGLLYIGTRIGGRALGGAIAMKHIGKSAGEGVELGMSLLPQAGIAIGTALIASQLYPQLTDILLPTALGATVIFELLGPPILAHNLKKHRARKKALKTP
jgi:NhaP-type Na+/H+ or K+/H+ antiporter